MDPAQRLEPPVEELLQVAASVIPNWLGRLVTDTASASGVDLTPHRPAIDAMVASEGQRLTDALRSLLATDVEAQRTNPLSLFRAATAGPTALLREIGVPSRPRDRFSTEAFPHDLYGLIPAGWNDIDPALQDAGIAWGAWKAMTVLSRHRPKQQ